MFSKAFLSILPLILAVLTNPIVSRDSIAKLSLSRQINTTGIHNVLKRDQARARYLVARARGDLLTPSTDEPATNVVITYVASVGVGSPPTQYSLLIDTGSSVTWVGAGKSYVKTGTSKEMNESMFIPYGSGLFLGTEYTDAVTLGTLKIQGQSIGVADLVIGFSGFDGILGIGPVGLTNGSLFPSTNKTIPTVTGNLFTHKLIPANQIGISFEPATGNSTTNGELTWGDVDCTKFTGSVHYTPLTTTFPARKYWGIDQSITYGNHIILATTSGIVDTGTTLVLIATDAFQRYQNATGSVQDSDTGLLRITPSQFQALKTLNFHINGETYGLTPNAQIWPRSLNTVIGGSSTSIYLIVADFGRVTGAGLDFINGYAFLERFYSVFDTANKRVGFATTPFTEATTN